MLELSMCNEMLADEGLSLDRQCEVAVELGYMGLELALGSLVARPHELTDAEATAMRRTIEGHGLTVTGLHWLLAPYPDLSITEPDSRDDTQAVLLRLVDLCAVFGGRVLVHGSPGQRRVPKGSNAGDAVAGLADFFAPVAEAAERAGVTYCIEPLARTETDVINTVEQGAALVDRVGSPAIRTMIDTCAAGLTEELPVAELITRWAGTDAVAHVQVNDTNRGAPGTGSDPFLAITRALREANWPHPIAVEPFRSVIDATTTADIAAATMRTCWEAAA